MKPLPQYLTQQTAHSVCEYIRNIVSDGDRYKVSFKPVSQRTLDMNKKIHAMCADIARQVCLSSTHGWINPEVSWPGGDLKYFAVEDIKHILMAGFTKSEIVPGIEPGQAVCLYPSTTDLGIRTGGDFIEYMTAWGNEMGVQWTDE